MRRLLRLILIAFIATLFFSACEILKNKGSSTFKNDNFTEIPSLIEPTEPVETTIENSTMYATKDVNVRSGLGESFSRIGVVYANIPVTITGQANNWYIVTYKGQVGYINKNSLTKVAPSKDSYYITYKDHAKKIMDSMSLEEKIGQMFFVACDESTAAFDITTYHLGGYIFFAENTKHKTPDQLKSTIDDYQNISKINMMIGVDEEGGTVNRLSKYSQYRSSKFSSPQELYARDGLDLIKRDTIQKSTFLKNLGINLNLAPVCDISLNSKDYIYQRTLGKDVKETAKYTKTVVEEMNKQKIGSTLKHFPGYGNNNDTHTGIAIDNRSYDTFLDNDFVPFKAGIDASCGSILVSHNIVKSIDSSLPASLSPKTHQIIREDLGFDGVIMTDDLKMDAISKYTDDKQAAILAIVAGNDCIISTNYDIQISAVISAIKEGIIKKTRIEESVLRLLCWKLSLGIID